MFNNDDADVEDALNELLGNQTLQELREEEGDIEAEINYFETKELVGPTDGLVTDETSSVYNTQFDYLKQLREHLRDIKSRMNIIQTFHNIGHHHHQQQYL
jgi:hypothetical protein